MPINDYEEVNVEIDAALTPLGLRGAGFIPPVAIPVAGAIHAIDGMLGPDITFSTGAPVNGIAVVKSSVGNVATFSITGPGTMAQRNAVAAIADIATIDAIDPATTMALVNELKAKINALLAAMRTAGHLTP